MKVLKNKIVLLTIFLIGLLLFVFAINQFFLLRKAHSTFENYYTFRGCTQILKRTQDYGICKINTGQTIKIVKFQGKWYLDGDLPWACLGRICFGI